MIHFGNSVSVNHHGTTGMASHAWLGIERLY